MASTERTQLVASRILNVGIIAYPLLALIAFLVIPFLADFSSGAGLVNFITSYAVGLAFLAGSVWIFIKRRSEPSGRAFVFLTASIAVVCAAWPGLYVQPWLSYLWLFAAAWGSGALVELALVFPLENRWVKKHPDLSWVGYLLGLVLFIVVAWMRFSTPVPSFSFPSGLLIYVFSALAVLFFISMLSYRRYTSRSPVLRQQSSALLAAALIGFGPLSLWLLVKTVARFFTPSLDGLNLSPYLLIFTVIFPLLAGYTILHDRFLRTDILFRQSLLYAFMTILAVGGYALMVAGLTLIFGQALKAYNPWFICFVVLVLALGLNILRDRLQRFIDHAFFRGVQAYEKHLQDFNRELTNTVDLAVIVRTLRQHIATSLSPERQHIYIYEPVNDIYSASVGEDGHPSSDIHFTTSSPLVNQLQKSNLALFIDESSFPPELESEHSRLALLGTPLLVPFSGSGRPVGWLAVGLRRSGENYSSHDLAFLDRISSAAGAAVAHAQVIFNLERRVREMNILARVAQGVNVTVAFDDILELIYAQTSQVLQANDFHLTLYNKESNFYYFAFCLEKDDRLTYRENLPLYPNTDLSPEVIGTRRAILTSDYSRECQVRSVTPLSQGIHAWAGVPLNTGAETIGALSVGSRDPGVTYTSAQQDLLQSIAEQAAGAIVKARLFQETEWRAHQLASLNEITRQLTGTLETEPLMQKILDSAVTILNCEAGSLFLVDETTDELVFNATNGIVAQNLQGQRLPPGTGIVGEAVQSRKAVMTNNVEQSPTWSASTDRSTGFITRAVLAVPMQIKEHVMGVIEVINRKDGLPFTDDDQNLISAFAGQAAVSIENARLYTLTDQELNARVEELSVMQRIDRELNASLDVARAMRLTLEWAMRQSAADAGLIGILEEKGIRLMAQQGYEELAQQYKDTLMPLEQPSMRKAIETNQPQRLILDENQPGLLVGARSQVVVPIHREANAIGLIVLESRTSDPRSAESLSFLDRLSDHAAIAIANAQLYHEVQTANEAKSEFVSFVAHELKNPMTSIKGYTELIAKGAVGSITDMQANFLATIHSNVERMSTLVSDLNDNSKIEAGRLRMDFKALALAETLDEVMRSTRRQMDDKKQSAVLNIPEDLPRVWADPTRLAQIITNLVSNAHKYTPEGGTVTVGAEKCANQWDPDGAAEVVHLWVQDTGIGISLDDQKKIFQKFFRSEDSKAREAPGTGLGLNITRSLVEMMGGRIWFESEFRHGTVFHFTIPTAQG